MPNWGFRQMAIKEGGKADLVELSSERRERIPRYVDALSTALASQVGARVTEMPVRHHERLHGQSKYGISRTMKVILDLMTVKFLLSYATRPLHIFGLVGIASGAAGFLLGVYLTVQKLFYFEEIGGRPLLLLAVLLIFIGFQFITMGLLGEMLARTYHESQNKPTYVIKEILGGGESR